MANSRSIFRYTWVRHGIGIILAFGVVGPLAFQAMDRKPPWYRISGSIDPVPAGGFLTVTWQTTPLVRACPGTLQVELLSGNLIWPVFQRPVSASTLGETRFTPPPWPVPSEMPLGLAAYRVTSFWYCNWVQEFFDWPIVQVGPDIIFTVLPEEKKR